MLDVASKTPPPGARVSWSFANATAKSASLISAFSENSGIRARFLICIDFLMKSVPQPSEETLWFSQQLQDSPGEIVVFDQESPSWWARWVLGVRPDLGIGISLFSLREEGQREVEDAPSLGFSLCQTGTENPAKKISMRIQEGDSPP